MSNSIDCSDLDLSIELIHFVRDLDVFRVFAASDTEGWAMNGGDQVP